MYDGYLSFGGSELLNISRSAQYVSALIPGLEVVCETPGQRMATVMGHQRYVSPKIDKAPWVKERRPDTFDFYGLFPGKIEGVDSSSREVTVTELSGDGAVHSMPRHGSKEIRVVATALAKTENAMHEGMAWLRDVLDGSDCRDTDELGCFGNTVKMLYAFPTVATRANGKLAERFFYQVETLEGPTVTKVIPFKNCVGWEIEFVLSAGKPWSWSNTMQVADLDMDAALNFQDPAGEDCSEQNHAYAEYINDPYYTAISQPPRPPVIKPPNILDINSWRRRTAKLPVEASDMWGRMVPIVSIVTGSEDLQQLRIRFYDDTGPLSGCRYEGEFIVSYLPKGSVMTLDGIKREAKVKLASGRTVPGGHLLYGSDGRPFSWPTLGCGSSYTATVDLMPGVSGTTVLLDVAVRE